MAPLKTNENLKFGILNEDNVISELKAFIDSWNIFYPIHSISSCALVENKIHQKMQTSADGLCWLNIEMNGLEYRFLAPIEIKTMTTTNTEDSAKSRVSEYVRELRVISVNFQSPEF